MASLKTFFHRIFHGSCNRTNDKLMNKLKCIHESQSGTFMDHPYVKFMNETFEKMFTLIGKQCQVVGQHRARRTVQILTLYKDLYGAHPGRAQELLQKLRDILRLKDAKGKRLFLLSAVLFDWHNERITDDTFSRTKNDMKNFIEIHARSTDNAQLEDSDGEVWEKVVDSDSLKLWRCPVPGSSLYKYKVFGTYKDLPASAFYKVQLDLEYRKKWDKYVVKLERVEHDEQTGSEVIYWATHFPLNFMSSRDYLYVRRCEVDEKRNVMTISAKAVNHPRFPISDDFVRVNPYDSNMLIKPHTTFDEKGFDYVMYYYDDPKLYVPSWAINKMTLSSLPTFVHTIHEAAMKLHLSKIHVVLTEDNSNDNCNNSCKNDSSMQTRILQMSSTAYNYIDTDKNQS